MRRLFKSRLPLLASALIMAVGGIGFLLSASTSAAGHRPVPARSPSEIRLTSPNGKYSVVLTARDDGAFLFAQSADGRVAELTVNRRDSGFELFRDGVEPVCSVGAAKDCDPGLFTWPRRGGPPRVVGVPTAAPSPPGRAPCPAPCPARSAATRADLRELAGSVRSIVLETFETLSDRDRDPEALMDAIGDLEDLIDDLSVPPGSDGCRRPDGCECDDCCCDAGP